MNIGAARSTIGAISLVGLLVVGVGSGSHAGHRVPSSGVAPRAVSVPKPGPATSLGRSSSAGGADIASQYIVRFKNQRGLDNTVFDELLAGTALTNVWTNAMDGFVASLTTADVNRLDNDPDVVSVQPDEVVQTTVDQISPPWGLDRIDQQALPLNGGYSYTTSGVGVTAYIVDGGINTTHTDFSGRIARGSFVDFTPFNAVPPNPLLPIETADFEDCNGHGTHVAGIIGGTMHGVAKDVSLVPVKVFRCDRTTTVSNVITGLDWVIADHAVHPGPAVMNLSFGGVVSLALDTAVTNVIGAGVTVVVSAGNDNADACLKSPGHVDAVITVAASDILDHAASFTNHGPCVDLFAPGVGILSDWVGSPTAENVLNGTSMAAPHVAGVVARILEVTPNATPTAVWTTLNAGATVGALTVPIGDPNILVYSAPPTIPSPGFGPTPPGLPRSTFARALAGSVSLNWLPPFNDGRSAISGYTVSCSAPGQLTVTDPAAVSPWIVSGLANGVQYSCTVMATNAIGDGAVSGARTATPRTIPDALTPPTAIPAARKVTLAWTPPANTGGAPIKGYIVSCSDGLTTKTRKAPATALSVNLAGLTNGIEYSCNVAARNVAGAGAASGPSLVTPRTVPGAPQLVAISPGPASATTTFAAPISDGGAVITSYTTTCTSTDAGAVSPVTSSGVGSPMLVPGLTPSTRYLCKVLAINAAGTSRPSGAKFVIPTL